MIGGLQIIHRGTHVVIQNSIFVFKSGAMAFMVIPLYSRIEPELSSRIIHAINRKDDDLFSVKITEIQNDNLFAC